MKHLLKPKFDCIFEHLNSVIQVLQYPFIGYPKFPNVQLLVWRRLTLLMGLIRRSTSLYLLVRFVFSFCFRFLVFSFGFDFGLT